MYIRKYINLAGAKSYSKLIYMWLISFVYFHVDVRQLPVCSFHDAPCILKATSKMN